MGAVDSRIRARGFDARSFVADVESVSGGTGFAILEVPEGIVLSAGNGFRLDANVAPRLDPNSVTLSLEWTRCRTTFESSLTFYPSVRLVPAGAAALRAGSGAPSALSARVRVLIASVREVRTEVAE